MKWLSKKLLSRLGISLAFRTILSLPVLALRQLVASNGALERIRTSDHLIRSQVLYPAELRAQFGFDYLKTLAKP